MEYQSLKIRRASIKEVLSNNDLMLDHWDEVVKLKHIFSLDPNDELYEILEETGKLFTLVCTDTKDNIIGYSVNIVNTHLHYQDVVVCTNDVIYLSDKYRNSTAGIRLIKETEKVAKVLGCHVIAWHAKPNTSLDKILSGLKNQLHEHIYLKEI